MNLAGGRLTARNWRYFVPPEDFFERLGVIFLPVLPADSVQPGGAPAQQVGVELALGGHAHRAVRGGDLVT